MNPAPRHPPTERDLETQPWDYIDAVLFFSRLVKRVGETDFVLSIHGSLLRQDGAGNDLDLIATQWKEPGFFGSRQGRFERLLERFTRIPELKIEKIDTITERRVNVKFYYYTNGVRRIVDLLVVLL